MLPSRGFFKKNDCPFYEKGLCVRPHCHFRHRKKIVNEIASSLDSQDDLQVSDSFSDIPIVSSINSKSVPVSSSISDKTTDDQHSVSSNNSNNEQSSHDSLFAKLVNQSNPYERISRHIPCAYTPTPQIKSAQPKNRTLSVKSNINSSLPQTQTYSNNYKSVNKEQNDVNLIVPNQENKLLNSEQKFSINSQNAVSISWSVDSKLPHSKNNSDALTYEPQSTSKTILNNLDESKSEGDVSSYVPSKVITTESKYVPNSNNSSLSNDYIPSKDKPKQNQYVPESTSGVENHVNYKPSDKTSTGETKYQPGNDNCLADYVPTEKSATKSGTSWLTGGCENDLTEFEFISSEIEMMKKLLKDEIKGKKEAEEAISKTESVEEKKEKSHKEKSSKRSHSSSSRHRSESSRHSSKSRHSSSSSRKHSSRSSRHHSKSSSRHHSSSRSRSKSSSHRKSSSSSHKSRHSSHKSHSSSSHSKDSEKDQNEKRHSEKKKKVEVKSDDDDSDHGVLSEGDCSEQEGSSEEDSGNEAKKRKMSLKGEEQRMKLLKKEEAELFDLEDDPDTIEKQCLEIFNSYSNMTVSEGPKKANELMSVAEECESVALGKKRTAHSTSLTSDHTVLRHKTAKKSHNIKSAQEVMLERYKTIEKAKDTPAQQPTVQPAPILGLSRPSIKIAAVTNIQQMLEAKKAIQEKINQGLKVNERTTIAQTLARGVSRVAHTPTKKDVLKKPTISFGSKQVPQIKRQLYLDKLLLETNKIYPTKGEAAEEALKLEEEVFQSHSGSAAAYHAAFFSLLMKTRRRVAALQGETSQTNQLRPKVSHFDVLSGGKKNFSVIKTKKVDISMLSDRHIYEELYRCKLTREELKENGFPMEGSRTGYATCSLNFELKYNEKYIHIKKLTGNRRYCIRCSKQYEVDPLTLRQYIEGPETCCYHPGKKKSGGRNCDRIYNCCNSSSTEGCATHVRHVTDCNNYENYPSCVKTLSKRNEKNPGVFALDCEMVYTRLGTELARVTVVNLKKEIVYDTLVKPKYPIECYNTFYSGIEEKMMEGVDTTLKDVQAVLLNLFSDKTILIGHSLDSDLRALHLIHDTVVDTAVFYKHEKYHPHKYALKELCARKISKIIQDNVNGHDSAEDAIAALEIMLNYVKEEVSKYDSMESYERDRFA